MCDIWNILVLQISKADSQLFAESNIPSATKFTIDVNARNAKQRISR